MTRLWKNQVIYVLSLDDKPASFRWRGRSHRITHISERRRIDKYWWRERIWRDYYTVLTHTHMLVEIYHDLLTDRWYLQRVYD